MSDAQIIHLTRLDLPQPPTGAPAYYVADGVINGLGSIYLHTPDNTWWKGGRPINVRDVPEGARLKKLGAIT